jgi:tRNA (guanine37-N1)-methyltransferase
MIEPRRFTVITLFPEMIAAFAGAGIVRRACERQIVAIDTLNPRVFAEDTRATVDDTPYGGGPGMVMTVAPLRKAIRSIRGESERPVHVVYLSPQGRTLSEAALPELAQHQHIVLLAGRYEGIDERLIERDVDSEWSLGDFVMSGGEIAAMAVIDALTRRLPGALGDERSAMQDSFGEGLLDHPHYTRPELIDGQAVPAVLLSGNHAEIDRWRRREALGRTWLRRPELLSDKALSVADQKLLNEFIKALPAGSKNGVS